MIIFVEKWVLCGCIDTFMSVMSCFHTVHTVHVNLTKLYICVESFGVIYQIKGNDVPITNM